MAQADEAARAGTRTGTAAPQSPEDVLRSAGYTRLLLLAAIVGAPISAAAYFFLQLVSGLQEWTYTDLPRVLGFSATPLWWPFPLLAVAGLAVGAVIRYLPGRGGHSPADGFHTGAVPVPRDLPGILLAALAGLGLGVVLGPEAPLIALGGGLGVLALHAVRRGADGRTAAVLAATGSFAAISALLGSPILGAFLLMEASLAAGAALGVILLPGLLAAGIGSLIFLGLDSLTGLGTASLTLPGLPAFGRTDIVEFGWAVLAGLLAALVGVVIHRLTAVVRRQVEPRIVVAGPVVGVVVAGLAVLAAVLSGHDVSFVLFSGQEALGPLLLGSAGWAVPSLVIVLVAKVLTYALCLATFRGGPIFPALFIGAAGGVLLSHLPGLPLVAGAAIGIGAMSVVMLRLPITSVLLATLLLGADGLAVMPLVIVAVVVAHVTAARLAPAAPTV
ncbi:chloride channel protein [Pseudonocardia sp. NPDC049154]|uniref:chloride channel protein n=1 Tax=Pseudonocardia sp. NPDC049154 TaxID=3155501 RepID=UPI0033F08055